jgi:hypothetical protein
VAVKSLAPGDILEFSSHLRVTKPLASGQFWMEYEFDKGDIVTRETLEVSIPAGRPLKIKNRGPKPETLEQGGRQIYRWNYSNPKRHEQSDDDEQRAWKKARGRQDQPDILLSSYSSWDEVGRWYEQLQDERVRPTAEIQAKAAGLTKNASDQLAKLKAIYTFVSTRYRTLAWN